MKLQSQKTILILSLASAVVFAGFSADVPVSASLNALKSVTLAELPHQAATLVAAADEKNLPKTVEDVVKAAVGLNPAAVLAIVGAIASETPAAAATAAATAAALVPKFATLIAKTAAEAAPKEAAAIVTAVCQALPDQYKSVAIAVSEAVPAASREILAALAAAVPAQAVFINNSLAKNKGPAPSVAMTLSTPSPSFASLRSGGSPYGVIVPLLGTKTGGGGTGGTTNVIDPGTGGVVTTNSDYSTPNPTPASFGLPPG
ncbi:MAG: hypothetical protein WCS94_08515 [Verrucomicrobiota bacterium]